MKFDNRYSVVFNGHVNGFRQDFINYLYNSSKFIGLKEGFEPVWCQLLDKKERAVLVNINFLCDDVSAVSLPQAPFGGIHYDRHHVSPGMLNSFVGEIIRYFTVRNFEKIVIKSPAGIYSSAENAILTNCLVNCGFVISNYDINHHIRVDRSEFSTRIHKMENRKLAAAVKQKFEFKEVKGEAISQVYHFISQCRVEKKTPMNITFRMLRQTVKTLPENYKFFTVNFNGAIIAATVAVLVHESILYNYLPASSAKHNKRSPMVFLLHGLYQYCQAKGVNILDLGISTLNGQPQEGLILFKERVGGEASLKLTFVFNCN